VQELTIPPAAPRAGRLRYRSLLSRLRPREDGGSVATIVAIMLGGGVLLGMGALTVDVGQLYVERQELQSGADAAAMAIAQDCAKNGIDECRTRANTIAAQYADLNAKDGESGVLLACVNDGTEAPCSAPSGNLTDCIEEIPGGTPYAEVKTRTSQRGTSLLMPTFARALAGNSSYPGTTVAACSRSSWQNMPTGQPYGLTISNCEYKKSIDGNGAIIEVHYRHTQSSDCGTETSGFGLVKGPGDCLSPPDTGPGSQITDSQYEDPAYPDAEHSAIAAKCEEVLKHSLETKTPILIPVFEEWEYNGARKWFNVAGMAGFVVTGYAGIPGVPTWRQEGDCDCMQGQACLYGYFLPGFGPAAN
jgi:hypothetical protein